MDTVTLALLSLLVSSATLFINSYPKFYGFWRKKRAHDRLSAFWRESGQRHKDGNDSVRCVRIGNLTGSKYELIGGHVDAVFFAFQQVVYLPVATTVNASTLPAGYYTYRVLNRYLIEIEGFLGNQTVELYIHSGNNLGSRKEDSSEFFKITARSIKWPFN